jgi:hypothetical protein
LSRNSAIKGVRALDLSTDLGVGHHSLGSFAFVDPAVTLLRNLCALLVQYDFGLPPQYKVRAAHPCGPAAKRR